MIAYQTNKGEAAPRKEGSRVVANIKFKQTKFLICTVHLKPNWQLKTNFKITKKNTTMESQRKEIGDQLEQLA